MNTSQNKIIYQRTTNQNEFVVVSNIEEPYIGLVEVTDGKNLIAVVEELTEAQKIALHMASELDEPYTELHPVHPGTTITHSSFLDWLSWPKSYYDEAIVA